MTKNRAEQLPAGATRKPRPVTKPATAKPRKAMPAAPAAGKPQPPGKAGDEDKRTMAVLAANGVLVNAKTLIDFASGTMGELSLFDTAMVLKKAAGMIDGGDMSPAELMLTAQASALNAIFGEMARRAALNVGVNLCATERYMQLALKAQAQSRTTWEALAAIKRSQAPGSGEAATGHERKAKESKNG